MKNHRLTILACLIVFILGISLVGFLLNSRRKAVSSPISPLAQLSNPPAEVLSGSTSSADVSPAPQPIQINTKMDLSGNYKIAILGDSMIDTLGDLKTLKNNLIQVYPNVNFNLLNYGIGSTNVDSGLKRLTENSQKSDQSLPPLLTTSPDLIIIESFAYNHGVNAPQDLSHHQVTLERIVETIHDSLPANVMILTTIGPNPDFFAIGAPGINWNFDQRKNETETIFAYLANAAKLAGKLNIPLIDATTPSLDPTAKGKRNLIEQTTNIHPSTEGIDFISDIISDKVIKSGLVDAKLSAKSPF